MKKLLVLISLVGLGLVIGPALLYLFDTLDKTTMKSLMLVGTILWFASVPFWMARDRS
jgi:hypothetical protein